MRLSRRQESLQWPLRRRADRPEQLRRLRSELPDGRGLCRRHLRLRVPRDDLHRFGRRELHRPQHRLAQLRRLRRGVQPGHPFLLERDVRSHSFEPERRGVRLRLTLERARGVREHQGRRTLRCEAGCLDEDVQPGLLALHSDNGVPEPEPPGRTSAKSGGWCDLVTDAPTVAQIVVGQPPRGEKRPGN